MKPEARNQKSEVRCLSYVLCLLVSCILHLASFHCPAFAGEEELKKSKVEFEARAKERFTVDFWTSPSRDPLLPPALRELPKDAFGYPDWTAAVRQGIIEPIDSLSGQEPKKEEEFNEDIIFEINDSMMANVRFQHSIHNYWFSCKVCHPGIFKPKKGANNFKMKDNWDGNYCGRCHGKVAYAPKGFENCIRCHSVKR
ncbi:MAG: hypothetical protein HY096_13880 [Nitrospinae bacterium]|nr:hypothetical protein [Nitrospinota bacterium]MBI5750243.1 hypothetical protein [Nitrospinota bacterium]